jgi:hypothetical protein
LVQKLLSSHVFPKDRDFNIIVPVGRVINSRRVRLSELVACMGEIRNAYKIMVGKT